jgi:anti-sigma regulatory factor (Ser/Thr protein kinase)
VESATVVLFEVITNAFVHVGTEVRLRVWATTDAVRVEVEDGAAHLPARRHYAATAGTGRGLQLMERLTDRWGAVARSTGKIVWFEIGDAGALFTPDSVDSPAVTWPRNPREPVR